MNSNVREIAVSARTLSVCACVFLRRVAGIVGFVVVDGGGTCQNILYSDERHGKVFVGRRA